jgi:hypothetical protein
VEVDVVEHNDSMHVAPAVTNCVAPACRRLSGKSPAIPVWVALALALSVSVSEAKTQRTSPLDPGYIAALAAADRYLQAWQSGDMELGLTLLSGRAKETVTADDLERIFSAASPHSYEIGRGKLLKRDRYEFPVVLVSPAQSNSRVHRRFSTIVVVNTGNNDWAVDKLP